MKHVFIILLLATHAVIAQETPDKTSVPKEAIMEKIFSTMGDPKLFPVALKAARQAGVHPQVIREARFLHNVDMRDDAAIAAMAPEFVQARDQFDPDDSEVFAVKEDWLGVVHYTQALAALQKGDKDSFKKHITEAFWLSPRQAQAFAPHIHTLRLEEAMKKATIDPNRKLKNQETGKMVPLGKLLEDKKALVLHFWSPMSQEAQVNMPDFILTTEACDKHGIGVASILIGQYPGIRKDAESIRTEDAQNAACTWLVDAQKKSLSNKMRITTLPTMVIVSPEGKILFNGQPSNKNFWATIKRIAPDFKRPHNHQHDHDHEENRQHDSPAKQEDE